MKKGPLRFQFHNTTGSPSKAKSPHKRAMGDMRRCMFCAKSSDLSGMKEPWNLSNAQTSAPTSYKGGLGRKGRLERPLGYQENKKGSHPKDSGEHDDEHGFIIRVVVNDHTVDDAIGEVREVTLCNKESL